jgi:fucose permease
MSAYPGFASRLFISGSLSFVLIGVLGAAYGVALPAFARDFDLGPGAAGLILTVQALGAVAAVLAQLAGVPGLSSRLAIALIALGTGIIALGPTWIVTMGGGVVAGAGFGLIATHVNRDFLTGFGPRGPGMVGLVNAVSGIGLIVGPLIYVWAGGSPRILFGGIAVLALAIIPLFPAGAGAQDGPRGLPPLWQPRMGVLGLNLWSVALEGALGGLGVTALIAIGWGEPQAAQLASGFFAAFLVARLSLYWLTRVLDNAHIYLLGVAGTAVAAGLAAAGFTGFGHVLSGATIALCFPAFFVWGARVLGPDPRMSAAMLLSGFIGGALGPLIFGAIVAVVGLPNLYLTIAFGAGALALVLAAAIAPARRLILREGR